VKRSAALGLMGAVLASTAAEARDRATLDTGDRSWATRDRPAARAAWQAAAEAADPAVRAQAEARLLLVSGNLGLAVHGPRAERALAVCPETDPWCSLASADLVLFARAVGVPLAVQDAVQAATAASPHLPGPAAARLVWAGAAPPSSLSGHTLDALGRAVHDAGGVFPSGPGTWVAGLGVLGSSGQGAGGGVRLLHPDIGLAGWRVDASAFVTTRLAGQATVRLRSPGTWGASGSIQGARLVVDRYNEAGGVRPALVQSTSAALQPAFRGEHLGLQVGPVVRWDRFRDTVLAGHGASASAAWFRALPSGTLQLGGGLSVAIGDYAHQEVESSVRWAGPEGRLAAWLHGQAAPWSQAPYWRLPVAGGGQVLRHGPIGRYRDRTLASSVLEWRLRPDATAGAVLFVEGARVDGWHAGAGTGLRLRLPPRPHNTIRLDLAVGDGGVGISAGWGEAF